MKRTRLGRTFTGFWKNRIKRVKPMWKVCYDVYERKGESLKPSGSVGEITVMAGSREEAFDEARRQVAPRYNVYHYGIKIKDAEKVDEK